MFENAELFPMNTSVNTSGNLEINGCDSIDLANQFGTPLYIYDETTIRHMARSFIKEFTDLYPNTSVSYASKAFLNKYIAQIANEENLWLDVVSGGEIAVAKSAGFPTSKMDFHGNNKTPNELSDAIDSGVGTIIVDGFHELNLLNEIAKSKNITQGILLRLSPSIDAHTHGHTTTGISRGRVRKSPIAPADLQPN